MSITALLAGKLATDPQQRLDVRGQPYTLARMSAHDGEAGALVSLIAFGTAGRQLAALAKGDALAVNGAAKVSTWLGKDGGTCAGLNVTVDAVLTLYGLKKRRDTVAAADASVGAPASAGGLPMGDESAADAAWLSRTTAGTPSNTEGA